MVHNSQLQNKDFWCHSVNSSDSFACPRDSELDPVMAGTWLRPIIPLQPPGLCLAGQGVRGGGLARRHFAQT